MSDCGNNSLGSLSPAVRCYLDKIQQVRAYDRADILFMEGQPANGIFLIRSGRAKVSFATATGRMTVVQIAERDEVIGLESVMASRPYSTTAEIMEASSVGFISQQDLILAISEYPGAALWVAHKLGKDFYATCEEIRRATIPASASEKVARFLIEWLTDHQARAANGFAAQWTMNLTHEEIACLIGTSRETVTRMLGAFKKRKLIQLKGDSLILLNKSGLEQIAEQSKTEEPAGQFQKQTLN